ncbi:MAG: class I tRNA ligase family protein, partial [bacterium]|nr:class I tRNA ligase family protein [bacterium]
GIFNGKNPKLVWDYLNKKQELLSAKVPKGESLVDLNKRLYKFLKEIDAKYGEKNILIVSHELPLTLLERALGGRDLAETIRLRGPDIKEQNKIKTIKTAEIRKIEFKQLPFNDNFEIDFHRPQIDEIKFSCLKCGGLMARVSEVVDCWFDSGSMPFAQAHWPFEQKIKNTKQKARPPELFPADYISEGVDQTRGWFYTLLAISTLLGFGPPYKNVISSGHVLDEKGEKMSKSRGNIVDPWYIIEKYGVDASRWYFYTINQPGEPKLFAEKDIDQSFKKFILTLWNCFTFWETYRPKSFKLKVRGSNSGNALDKWIASKLNQLILDVTRFLEEYDITSSARAIERFVIEDLSLWYVRRSRRRFQKPETKKELEDVLESLGSVLFVLSKLTAPFAPFLSEQIYLNLKPKNLGFESVHLEDWPRPSLKLINETLNKGMDETRKIVSQALAERAKASIKVRQPLSSLTINNEQLVKNKELVNLIKDEVNVKNVVFGQSLKLDTEITAELKEEGIIREIIRHIQDMRKEAGLRPQDRILVNYATSENLGKILNKSRSFILKEARVGDLISKGGGKFDAEKQLKIGDDNLSLGIKKIK